MNWEEIRKEYELSSITLKALAEKYDIKTGTLKSRKSREGWARGSPKKDASATKKDATKTKRVATKQEKVATFKPVIESDELTEKQKLFCLYYIKYYNATKSYKKAYGCSHGTASVEGSRTLAKPHVRKEIERLKAEMQQVLFLDAQAVLQKLIDIAFADVTDFITFGHKEVPMIGENGPIRGEDGELELKMQFPMQVLISNKPHYIKVFLLKNSKESFKIYTAELYNLIDMV